MRYREGRGGIEGSFKEIGNEGQKRVRVLGKEVCVHRKKYGKTDRPCVIETDSPGNSELIGGEHVPRANDLL